MRETSQIITAALRLTEQAAADDWRGPDPYDGLWWHWPRPLVGGRRRRQALTQLHVRSPFDVRLLYRREHALAPKTVALFGSAGLRAHRLTGDERFKTLALQALDVLDADTTAGPAAWGYHFDVQTRWSFYPAHSPSIVNCAFAVGALLEAERDASRNDLGDRARVAARWVLDELWIEPEGYFAYHPHSRVNIHNANLLGAWLVWTALGHEPYARECVARSVARTLAAQRADGSWPYGEGGGQVDWADSFHSGYVLSCLDRVRDVDPNIDAAVARGAEFYTRFFGPAGQAQLWSDRRFPEDGHSAGTGLTTLALLTRRGLIEREMLDRVAQRLLTSGIRGHHAVFRRYRYGLRTLVHYVRWCDAHVALGLVDAAVALAGEPDPGAASWSTTRPGRHVGNSP